MYLQVDAEDSMFFRNVGIDLQIHTAPKPKKPLQQHGNIALIASNLINLVLTTAD
jgi:hypothetical protein